MSIKRKADYKNTIQYNTLPKRHLGAQVLVKTCA